MTVLGLANAVRTGREDAEHAAELLTPADLLAWSDEQAQIAAAAAEARNPVLAAQHRAAAHTARRLAAIVAEAPSPAPSRGYSAGHAVGDAAAVATGFAAGAVLNARYPEGVSIAGLKVKPSIPLGVGGVVGGVAVKRLWGMRRTGRALIAGGIGSGLATLGSSQRGSNP